MSAAIAAVVSARIASLHDLSTSLGTEDLYDLLEILQVDRMNRRIASLKKA